MWNFGIGLNLQTKDELVVERDKKGHFIMEQFTNIGIQFN